MRSIVTVATILLVHLAWAPDGVAQPVEIDWTGFVNQSWIEPLNWSPDNVPNSEFELARIAAGGVYTVELNLSGAIGGMIIANPDATVGIPSGFTPSFYGDIENNGTFIVNFDNGPGGALNFFESITLSGTGQLIINENIALGSTSLGTGAGAVITNALGHFITGAGDLNGQVINDGIIDANLTDAILFVTSLDKTNNHVMRATDGGILSVEGLQTLTQGPSGLVLADNGTVRFGVGNLVGGTVNTVNGGTVQIREVGVARFTDVANLGIIDMRGGARLEVDGTGLVNDGVITVDAFGTGISTILRFVEDGVLGGTGEVVLNASNAQLNNANLNTNFGVTVTQGADHTVRGVGFMDADFVNEGTVRPGFSAGEIMVQGTFVQLGSGLLAMEVGGTLPGEFDELTVIGTVDLGGTLEVTLIDGYEPVVGDSIRIISGGVSGIFDTVLLPAPVGGVALDIRYEPDGVFLDAVVPPAIPFVRGDADGDGSFSGLQDGLFVLGFGFLDGPAPVCMEAADGDGDGTLTPLIDAVYLLTHQFLAGPPPPAPYPDCGVDPAPPGLGCDEETCL